MPRHPSIFIAVVVFVAPVMLFATRPASGADAVRGAALYDLRCGGCHSESVHGRAKRVATDFEDVRRWVNRWNATLALRWAVEEVEDVTLFLNATYYRYPCPPTVCKVVSTTGRPGNALQASSSQRLTDR